MQQFISFPDIPAYAGMALLISFAALMQGIGGVGFAMFAAPIAAIFFPQLVPGPLLTLGGSVALLTALRERHAINWPFVAAALAGRAAGTLVAVFVLAQMAQPSLNLLFATLILVAVGLSAIGLRIATSTSNIGVAGMVSGIMGTLTSVGAPPLAIALQHIPVSNLRATLGITLFCGAAFSLTMLSCTGHYTAQQFFLSIALFPFMLLGFAVSGRIHKKVSPVAVRRLLLMFCAISAIGLILKTI